MQQTITRERSAAWLTVTLCVMAATSEASAAHVLQLSCARAVAQSAMHPVRRAGDCGPKPRASAECAAEV
jgi:hypothetical protein